MTRDEYQNLFNSLLKDIAQLLEVSGNENLVRIVKKKLYDFSDKLQQGERVNDKATQTSYISTNN